MDPFIFLAIPTRGAPIYDLLLATHRMGRTKVHSINCRPSSLLTFGFNILWAECLNARDQGITHWVMCHDDIDPIGEGWLDTLVAEHEECGADITHVISPIKDHRGICSTSLLQPRTRELQRLTMTEVCKLPKTFDSAIAGYPDRVMLPNTGLWICDMTKPWVEKICFTIRDRMNRLPDGKFQAQCFSEDWHFGLQAMRLKLKVFATTAVKIAHHGDFSYPNFEPWGTWKTDEQPAIFDPIQDGFEDEDLMPKPIIVRM